MTSRTTKETIKSRDRVINNLKALGDSQADSVCQIRTGLVSRLLKLNDKLEKAGYGR